MRYVCSFTAFASALLTLAPFAAYGQISTLSITNYQFVSEQRSTRTQWYVTYKADLVNGGTALSGVTATVASQVSTVQIVPGQGTLHFGPVAANGRVTSTDSFTMLIDRSVTFDWSALKWSFLNPVANAGSNQTARIGNTVTLNGSGSTNPSGAGTLTYSWALQSLPPGSKAALSNANTMVATFLVDASGTYTARLTVSNGTATDSATVTVSTVNSPPVANAGPNQTAGVGATATLNGAKSSDVDGDPITYIWTFISVPPQSSAILWSARSVSPSFTVDKVGTYIVQLVVNDGKADSQPSTVTVSTANTPPVAKAGMAQNVGIGALVQLDGSGSTDVDGDPLTYHWSFNAIPSGSKAALSDPAAVKPTFTADLPGTYNLQLIVNDGHADSQPATATITTSSVQAPTANAGNGQTVAHGSTVTLTGSGTDPQNLSLTFTWSLITRPPGSTAALSANNVSSPTFVADQPGKYVAQLVVSNPYLSSAPSTVTITTTNTPPVADGGGTQNVYVGTTVTLDCSKSYDSDHDPITYSWSFLSVPSGSTAALSGATTQWPTFQVDKAGTYVVQLIVSDPFSSSTPVTVTVTAGMMKVILSPDPLNLSGAPGTLSVTLSPGSGPNPVTVTLSNYNPAVISLASNTVTVPANSTGVNIQVTPVAEGNTLIIANATGYQPGSASVVVTTPTISLALNNNAGAVGLTHSIEGTVTLSGPAPSPYGTTVSLINDPAAIGQISFNPSNVTVPAGSTTAKFTATGTRLGQVSILGTAPGYSRGWLDSLVVMLGGVGIPTNLTVPPGQSAGLNVQLSTPAPVDGATVNLSSSDTGILTVSPASVQIKPGATTPDTASAPQLTGVKPGSATITVSSGGFSSNTQTVKVIATITFSTQTVSVGPGGVQSINVLLSAPAPTGGLPVTFSSSSPSVATVTPSIQIGAGLQSSSIEITGVAAGVSTITASTTNQFFSAADVSISAKVSSAPTVNCPTTTSGEVGLAFNSPAMNITGGVSPYTFSVSSGSLPAGLTLNSSTGAINGTPTASGNFTIQVKDSNGTVATTTCPFTIAAAPALTCPASTSGEVGIAFSSPAMTVAGGVSPYTFSVSSGSLPAGLTLNSSTGAISGTPSASGNFTIQVKDANGATASPTCPFTIAAAPSLSCPASSSGEVGMPFESPAMTVTGGVSPFTFSVATGSLPGGLTLNSSTGAISGTPTATGTFSIKMTDANGVTAAPTCSFSVVAALSLTCPASTSGEVGLVFSSPAMTVTGGKSPFTFSVASGSLPGGLTLNSSTGEITGTPTASGTFTIKVTDGNGATASPACSFNIVAAPSLTCPAGSTGEVGIAFNSPAMTVTGGKSPFVFSVATGSLPAGLTLNSSTGAIDGTPTAGGNFTIQVKDANGVVAASPCSFSIAAAPSLTCPTSTSGEVGLAFSSSAITVSGGVSPFTFSVATGTLPAGLSLNSSTGAITGMPTASGAFTIQMKDAKGVTASPTCSFSIAAGPTLTCPTSTSGEVGLAFSSSAIAVSGGVGPFTFSVINGSLPGGLTLNSSTGAISGTPTASGSFTIQVKDSNGAVASPSCTFTIAAAPALTCPASTSGEVGMALSSPAMTVTGGVGPFTFSVGSGALPAGLTLNTSTGAISGTPTASGTFTIRVTDTNGVIASPTCPFTIAARATLTCPASTSGEVGLAFSSSAMTVTGGVAPFTFSVATGSLPGGLTLNTSTGVISGTPTATGTFTIQVKDSIGVTATPTCSFNIVAGPSVTCPVSTSGEVGVAFTSPAITVNGGLSPFTFSVATGSLPGGLTLNSSTGAISGTPTASGSFTLQVKDANGAVATPTCTFNIAAAPTITCPSSTSGEVGVAFSSPAMTVNGGVAPFTFSVTNGPLPGGLTLNSSTGSISGMPTASGSFSIQMRDANGVVASPSCPFTIAAAPTVTCPVSTSGEVGLAFSSAAITVNGGVGPFTFSVINGSLPGGLTLNSSTGAISGTPTAAGSFGIQLKDANGVVAAPTCSFTIAAAPTVTCPASTSGEVGVAFSSAAMAFTGGVGPFTFSVINGSLPGGLTLNSSTGAISGTPTATGSFGIQLKDSNGVVATPTCSFTIAAAPTVTCPASTSGEVGVVFNSAAMTINGGVGPFTFSVSSGSLPGGLTLNTSTGAISGTPTGSGSFSIQVKDANGITASPSCSFTIAAAPTVTCPASGSGEVGVVFNSAAMTINGGVGPFTFSVINGTLPGGLTLNSSTGAISGTPTASGSFTLQVKDSNGVTASPTCPFTIAAAPTVTCPASSSGEVGLAFSSAAITVNGGVGPFTFSVTNGSLPAGLTLNSSTGAISGTPSASGSFTIQVKDSNGVTAAPTCPFTIAAIPALTCPATNAGVVGSAFTSPDMTVTGGVSPFTFSVASGSLPGGLTLNSSTGAISGTPTATGSFSIRVKDVNGVNGTPTCSFTISAAALQISSSSPLPSGADGVYYSTTVAAQGGTLPYTWSITSGPAWLTISPSTGTLSGSPRSPATYYVTVSVTDSSVTKQSVSKTFSFVIGSVPLAITTVSLPSATLNQPYTTAIAASGGTKPYTWSLGSGAPSWLSIDSSGNLSGTPPAPAQNYSVPVIVKDASPTQLMATQTFTLAVSMFPGGQMGTITVPSPTVGNGLQAKVAVTLDPPPPVDVQVTITSNTPGLLLLGSATEAGRSQLQVTVPANSSSAGYFYAKALGSSGTPTITASAGGYNSGTGTVTLAPSAFVLEGLSGIGGNFTTYQNVTTTLTVYAGRLSGGTFFEQQEVIGGSSIQVPISVAPSSLGALSVNGFPASSVTFTGGMTNTTVDFKASSTSTGAASIIISEPSGFATPTVGGTINVLVQQSGLIPPSGLAIGKNLQTYTTIKFNGSAPATIPVTVHTTDARIRFAKGWLDPGSDTLQVDIPINQTESAMFVVRAYDSTGSAAYTISAPGYGSVNASIALAPSALLIHTIQGGDGGPFTIGLGADYELDIQVVPTGISPNTRQYLAADKAITATVTSSDGTVGTITTQSVGINGGDYLSTTFFHPVGTGTTTITASASDYASSSVQATTYSNAHLKAQVDDNLIGQYLESSATLLLTTAAPAGGLQVTLKSNSSLLKLAAKPTDAGSDTLVLNLGAGSTVAIYYVYSLGSTGTATYTASASGYSSYTDTVTLLPSGIVIQGGSTASVSGGAVPLAVYTARLKAGNAPDTTQSLAGPSALVVSLTNSNPTAGTLTGESAGQAPVSIAAGGYAGVTYFTPKSAGTVTTISVNQPAGWTTPSVLTQVGISVGN